jgi:hypothetical protein
MSEPRFSGWVGGQFGQLAIEDGAPVFWTKDRKQIEANELRQLGVDLAIPQGATDSEANARVRQVREMLLLARIPVIMARPRFV